MSHHFLQGDLVLDEQTDFDVHRIDIFFQLLVTTDRLDHITLQELNLHLFIVVTLQFKQWYIK